MQCDEKKEICLNYAANVPEWKLALILDALAKLGDASRCCGTVQKAVAGGQSYMRLHPDSEYAGEDQADYVHICQEAARALAQMFTGRKIRPSTTGPQHRPRQSPSAPAAGSP